ncbi:nuclear RNA export factor 1-like [Cloeon dipterum]|uniref:nuclear RNA export factor 1-like n=1 Tax=Cloeon dipterum TaxID=197152 RepID=UPI00321F6AC4
MDSRLRNILVRRIHHNEMRATWNKVYVIGGAAIMKTDLFNYLKKFVENFLPIQYQVDGLGNNSYFYLDDASAAASISRINFNESSWHFPGVSIQVSTIKPSIYLDYSIKEKIKSVILLKCYNRAEKSLNLWRLHTDPELVDCGHCALCHPDVMAYVLWIIGTDLSYLKKLNLGKNGLSKTNILKNLAYIAPRLQYLNLSENQFSDMKALRSIKGLPINEISLKGNVVCHTFKTEEDYHRVLLEFFPKLEKIDGKRVAWVRPLGFYVEPDPRFPQWIGDIVDPMKGTEITMEFLDRFYKIYDGPAEGSRLALSRDYHEAATFVLSAAYYRQSELEPRGASLSSYTPSLAREVKIDGNAAIVEFLAGLPQTRHDPSAITFHLTKCYKTEIAFDLTGSFNEPQTEGIPWRHFHRKCVLARFETGVIIVQDELHVTNAKTNADPGWMPS